MILSCQLLLNITNTQEAQYTRIVAKPNANILIFYWNPSQGQKALTHGGSSKVGSANCCFPAKGRGDSPQISLRTRLLTDRSRHPCRSAGGWNLGVSVSPHRVSSACSVYILRVRLCHLCIAPGCVSSPAPCVLPVCQVCSSSSCKCQPAGICVSLEA